MAVHMKGLAKLVSLRGGLAALGMNGLLAGEIQWLVDSHKYLKIRQITRMPHNFILITRMLHYYLP